MHPKKKQKRHKQRKGGIALLLAITFITNNGAIKTACYADFETLARVKAIVETEKQTEVMNLSETRAMVNVETGVKLKSKYQAKMAERSKAKSMVGTVEKAKVKMPKATTKESKKVKSKEKKETQKKSQPKQYGKLTDYEIGLICQIVQHEVGNNPELFPGYDFDIIQQYMARTVINRIGMNNWNNAEDVITAPKQYCSLEELSSFDANDEVTRRNVIAVANGEDGISEDVLFEMSWSADVSVKEAWASMERQCGDIYDIYYVYADFGSYKRLVIFGYQKK